jgi:hypothetical protein
VKGRRGKPHSAPAFFHALRDRQGDAHLRTSPHSDTFSGRESLAFANDRVKDGPPVVTGRKELEKLWKAWGVASPVPEADFSKEVVVVTTTSGSRLSLAATLDDKGNLQVLGRATLDFRPGFRYVIASVSRKGVKTVNGKTVPDVAGAQEPR